jgi:antitoxin component of MazEF toxin-antitoxin module
MRASSKGRLILIGERKIMPMGRGTLVVTIPAMWCHLFQLKAGDKIEFEMDAQRHLRLRPKCSQKCQRSANAKEQK